MCGVSHTNPRAPLLSLLFCFSFFLLYHYCTAAVVVLLYKYTHGRFVGFGWWMFFSAVYCALLLYTHIVGGWVG